MPIAEATGLFEKFIKPFEDWIMQHGVDYALNIITALVILVVGALVIKLMAWMLRRMIEQRIKGRQLLVSFAVSVSVKVAWIILMMIVLARLGVEVGPLIAGLGATGFILGFAFQESLGSLAAGMMIAFNQPFKIGDYVQVGGLEGTIKHLDMMAVLLATGDNRQITIPNKQAWGSPIINYSAMSLRRVDVAVGIAYGEDIAKAKEIARRTLESLSAVVKDPAPLAEVCSLDASSVALTCRGWVKTEDYWPTFFAANQQIKEAFDRNGIAIPFPQLVVHNAKD